MNTQHFFNIVLTKAQLNLKSEASKTYLSYLWWVLEPCLYIGVFYIVFGLLLQSKTENFVASLVTGLIPWLWFSKSVTNSSLSILSGRGLMLQLHISKLFFPSVVVVQDFLKQLPVVLILLIALILIGIPITPYWVIIFLLVPLQLFFIYGVSLFCALITPLLPDFKLILNTGLTLLMFGSGIFYEINTINIEYQPYFIFNPLATLIQSYRDILIYSRLPPLEPILYVIIFSIAIFTISLLLLKKLDHKFPRIVSER